MRNTFWDGRITIHCKILPDNSSYNVEAVSPSDLLICKDFMFSVLQTKKNDPLFSLCAQFKTSFLSKLVLAHMFFGGQQILDLVT